MFCSANVLDMTIKMLNQSGDVTSTRIYKDDIYYKLNPDERKLVDKQAKEIYFSTYYYPYP